MTAIVRLTSVRLVNPALHQERVARRFSGFIPDAVSAHEDMHFNGLYDPTSAGRRAQFGRGLGHSCVSAVRVECGGRMMLEAEGTMANSTQRLTRRSTIASGAMLVLSLLAGPALAQTLNVYTAWPESLSQPIFKAYTAKTGAQINFIRPAIGELVARATAERNNPLADVIWGAPGDGFAAAKEAGIIEPYRPPTRRARPSSPSSSAA
jgi:hypothetical protein